MVVLVSLVLVTVMLLLEVLETVLLLLVIVLELVVTCTGFKTVYVEVCYCYMWSHEVTLYNRTFLLRHVHGQSCGAKVGC